MRPFFLKKTRFWCRTTATTTRRCTRCANGAKSTSTETPGPGRRRKRRRARCSPRDAGRGPRSGSPGKRREPRCGAGTDTASWRSSSARCRGTQRSRGGYRFGSGITFLRKSVLRFGGVTLEIVHGSPASGRPFLTRLVSRRAKTDRRILPLALRQSAPRSGHAIAMAQPIKRTVGFAVAGPRPRPSPRKCSSPSPATPCTSASPRSSRGRPTPCSSPRTSTGRTPSGRPRAGKDRRGTPEGYVARRSARAPSHAGEHRLSSSSRRVTVFSLSRRSGFPARARSDRRADEISNASRALPSPSL